MLTYFASISVDVVVVVVAAVVADAVAIFQKCQLARTRTWGCIRITSLYVSPMNRLSKLECYVKLGWKGLVGTNTLTY
jgi:hypothetical protein